MEVIKGSARDIPAEPLIALCSILLARFARRYASNHQLTTHHEDRLAANPYIGDPLRSAANGNMNPARPTHGHSLHVDDALRGISTHETVTHEISAERTACAAGRRVFGDAELRREHATVHRCLRLAGLQREQGHRKIEPGLLAKPSQRRGLAHRPVDACARGERDEQERKTAGHLLDWHI